MTWRPNQPVVIAPVDPFVDPPRRKEVPSPVSQPPNQIVNPDLSGKKDEVNRAYNQRRDNDTVKNFTVSLMDIDGTILEYLQNKINIQVMDNGENVKVPIIYGSPERWEAIRKDGYLRDKKGQVQVPIMMFKRNTVALNEALRSFNTKDTRGTIAYPFIKKYSALNNYDRFSVINTMRPVHEIYSVTIPDHVIVTYEFVAWTAYVEQMNKVMETIGFASWDYWGDPKRFKFRVYISDFTSQTEVPTDADRIVRSNFTMTVNAYLLPEVYDNWKQTTQKALTKRKLVINFEVDTGLRDYVGRPPRTNEYDMGKGPVPSGPSGVATGGVSETIVWSDLLGYLAIQKTVIGTFVSDTSNESVVKFENQRLVETPAPLVGLVDEIEKFQIFVNGVYVVKSAIKSFSQVGNDFVVTIDDTICGYAISADDEIIAIGKFV